MNDCHSANTTYHIETVQYVADRPVASRQEEPDQHRVTPHSPHLRTSLSSLGGESLQEIWGMLDYGLSPKPITPTAAGDGMYHHMVSLNQGPFH